MSLSRRQLINKQIMHSMHICGKNFIGMIEMCTEKGFPLFSPILVLFIYSKFCIAKITGHELGSQKHFNWQHKISLAGVTSPM